MTLSEIFSFPKKKEDAFQQFFFRQDLLICRATAFLVMGIMLLLMAIDYYRVPDFTWVIMARMIVCGVLGLLLFLTFQKSMTARELQWWLLFINVIFLGSLFFMDSMTRMPPFYLPNSIVVYFFIAATVSGLRYRISGALSIVLMMVFLFYYKTSINAEFHKSQIPNIVISLCVSLLIGFIWERHKRRNFLQQTQLNSLLNIFSHDMVSPLNSLLSLLSLNDRNMLEKVEFDILVDSIKKTTHSNVLLLQNLVKWSKSQMDGFKPNAEPVPVSSVVNESINLLQNTAAEKNINVRNLINEDYTCLADLEMTKLILRNTIANAIKFSNVSDYIEIQAARNNGFITISVQDHGIGMSHEEIERLFTMRVQSTPGTANERGSGIGLFITREFVALNNGEIKIESEKENGSTVKISLPELPKKLGPI